MTKMRRMNHKGQGTLEYILVLLAVLLAVIVGASGPIKTAVGKMFDNSGLQIENSTKKLTENNQ